MSNFLAVATVSAALQRMLRPAVINDVTGADVTLGRPQAFTATPQPAVNIFLYHSRPNPSLRNEDLPTRRSDGSVVIKPRAPLELDYLFTFYGDSANLEPERLFGVTARTLNAFPQVTRTEIGDVVNAAKANPAHFPFLATTNLGDQVELVKLTQLPLSLEDMSRLWALFPDIPYALSIAYQASVVVIEQDFVIQPVLPVQRRDIRVNPINRPQIQTIVSAAGPTQPIVAGATLVITGTALSGPAGTVIKVAGTPLVPIAVSPSRLEVKLPVAAGGPPAGPVSLRVTQEDSFGSPPSSRETLSSEPVTFLLRPTVTAAALAGPAIAGAGGYSATFRITVDIPVQPGQAVDLLLTDAVSGQLLRLAGAAERSAPLTQVDFPVTKLPSGNYAVVLQVDGSPSAPPPRTVAVP